MIKEQLRLHTHLNSQQPPNAGRPTTADLPCTDANYVMHARSGPNGLLNKRLKQCKAPFISENHMVCHLFIFVSRTGISWSDTRILVISLI